MKIGRTFWIFTRGLMLAGVSVAVLSACQTLASQQGNGVEQEFVTTQAGFENSGMLNAVTFLGPDLMSSNYHKVSAQTWNDGYANTYKIESPQHIFVVQGTELAKVRIHEIEATETLRHASTAGAAGKAVVDRGVNLVQTPGRAVDGVMGRFAEADGPVDTLMVLPSGAVEIVGNLAEGLKQLGITGWRITTGAAGTRCQGVGACVTKAGQEVLSGANSLTGKHSSAVKVHNSVGTNPYSENKVLQRQVDRLAYTDSYVSTAVKLGLAYSNVPIIDPATVGIGYYNNAEFVAVYEDADKYHKRERALLLSWGVSETDILTLYNSKAFHDITRTKLTEAVSTFGSNEYKVRMIKEATSSSTRFVAESRLRVYQYLAELTRKGKIKAFVADLPSAVALDTNGTLILPFAADYLKWTPEIAPTIKNLARLSGAGKAYPNASVHVIGNVSPMFKQKTEALGVNVLELPPIK